MRWPPKLLAWLGASLALIGAAQAAEVKFLGTTTEESGLAAAHFRLSGAITGADVESVKAALAQAGITHEQDVWRRIVFALDSPGGSYQSGLDLALLFRRRGLATEVKSGDRCFSACALAFLGGTDLPKDPMPPADDGPLPDQRPDRSIEKGAALGFHAPYLDIEATSYTAESVEEAYAAAVRAIARLIAVADQLYVPTAELPKLLKPTRNELYMVDTVDAVRFLGIRYADDSLRLRDLKSFTPSMIVNACINRYHHLQRRSSIAGFAVAASVRDEFIEGSKLLENGEEKLVFGIRHLKQGTISTWLGFTPIAKTADGKSFVWCLFSPTEMTTFYKPGGTVAELFAELEGKNDAWAFWQSETTLRIGNPDTDWMQLLDTVPPETRLTEIAARVARYQAAEKAIPVPH